MQIFEHRSPRSPGLLGTLAALLFGATPEANAAPLGPPFLVNDTPGYNYADLAKVDSDGTSGKFVVVWQETYDDPYGVEGRLFARDGTPLGPDFEVNQTSRPAADDHSVSSPVAVAMDPAGGFVVTWHGYGDPPFEPYPDMPVAFLRLYDPDGNPRGDEFTTTLPTFEYDEHVNPEIAMDASGEFVVVWEGVSYYPYPGYPSEQGANESVLGQVYDSAGNPKGGQFQADIFEIYTQGEYGYLDVARQANGDSFVVVWEGLGPGPGSGYYAYPVYGVHGRRFLFDTGVASQFSIAGTGEDYSATDPEIAMDPAGNFMVVWWQGDGIGAKRFSKAGAVLGEAVLLSEDYGISPSVDADSAGNFVVVWDCGGRVLDALGNRRGAEFDVGCSSFSGCNGYGCGPQVATLEDEEFVVVWSDYIAGDNGIFARRFAMDPLAEVLLPGKSLLIRNGPVDVPELRRATWSARGSNVASPARGSNDDPRCNGDPSGTVKASIRFFSNDSGADTGDLDLPCQNWSATGPSSSNPLAIQGYKYKDSQLAVSQCTSVLLKRTKLIKATCREMPYHLVSGLDQGTVHAVLTLGQMRSCTSFDDHNGRDGSDGLRFQGKDAPAPAACPTP